MKLTSVEYPPTRWKEDLEMLGVLYRRLGGVDQVATIDAIRRKYADFGFADELAHRLVASFVFIVQHRDSLENADLVVGIQADLRPSPQLFYALWRYFFVYPWPEGRPAEMPDLQTIL